MLLHLALADDWRAAQAVGEYAVSTRGATLTQVGFVHCSTAEQWRGVRERFYSDLPDDALVLLSIDEARLTAEVRWEPPAPGVTELFPHVYGPVPTVAVVAVESVRLADPQ
ncbi:DUF952 domain-containing protein [Tsukamurella soli]|uniref:DUF952 domain-containing protein n=1 Tax=Tsukamurella soli TaxID=644556 RepID=A0ABP8JEQ5_9ACTN